MNEGRFTEVPQKRRKRESLGNIIIRRGGGGKANYQKLYDVRVGGGREGKTVKEKGGKKKKRPGSCAMRSERRKGGGRKLREDMGT